MRPTLSEAQSFGQGQTKMSETFGTFSTSEVYFVLEEAVSSVQSYNTTHEGKRLTVSLKLLQVLGRWSNTMKTVNQGTVVPKNDSEVHPFHVDLAIALSMLFQDQNMLKLLKSKSENQTD